ncbi:LuxR C-terminal-related transcriptional regulator [Actinoplanes sp. NPDC049316]|uniref:LuxR C-terminal-related transcriptional regulator n=1 Tax=Actinoplanes sp. NPDC049316 TaxID=3154727 RepID=UPI00342FD96B
MVRKLVIKRAAANGTEMLDLPPHAAKIVKEVAALADQPASPAERAAAILEPLRRVIPFRAARIALLDPELRQHDLLSCHGYNDRIRAYMTTRQDYDEIESLGLHGTTPLRVRDFPVAAEDLRSWTELFRPAGFLEGLGVGLVTRDGRQVGLLGLNTDSPAHPDPAACNLVQLLAPTIAYALDPLRSLAVLARIVQGMTAAAVFTTFGATQPLPGLATHPLLEADSALLPAAVAHLSGTPDFTTFLAPYDGTPAQAGHVRITVFGCGRLPPRHLQAVVAVSAPGDLFGLTGTELEILGALTAGATAASIAVARGIPLRAVEGHMEHIQIKLAVPDRMTAALRAAREGLYVPTEVAALTRP